LIRLAVRHENYQFAGFSRIALKNINEPAFLAKAMFRKRHVLGL
jgi:hypothetical protein